MAVELEDVSHLGNQGLVLHHAMQAEDADVLLAGILLRLDQASGTLDANDQTASDLGVQRSAVAGLVHTQDSFDPGNDFVGRGVGRFVQVDEAAPESPQCYHEPLLCGIATISTYSQKQYQNISLIKMLTLEISQTRYDCNLPIFTICHDTPKISSADHYTLKISSQFFIKVLKFHQSVNTLIISSKFITNYNFITLCHKLSSYFITLCHHS